MTTYDSESIEWCPQHGYTLPCPKCGMGEYERGLKDGRKEVAEWLDKNADFGVQDNPETMGKVRVLIIRNLDWLVVKLKEWGIE